MDISKKKVNKHSRKIYVDRGRYGVCKKEYYHFNCVDLYLEMLILLSCELIGKCRPCTNILKWVLEIMQEKWDDIRFISFEKALEVAKNLTILNSLLVDYYQEQKKEIKDICKKAKYADDQQIIFENENFFVNGDDLYEQQRDFIFNIIRAGDDLYNLDDFKHDDLILLLSRPRVINCQLLFFLRENDCSN